MEQMTAYLLLGSAYLLGSISSAIIVCRLAKLPDPRTLGSGNPGATNVLRYGGKKLAGLTLFGDVLKGILPVIIARLLNMPDWVLAGCGLLAFTGHLYPIFFNLKGGKGVATGFGALLALSWMVALSMLAIWLMMAKLFRYSSLSALTATLSAPVLITFIEPKSSYIIVSSVIALAIFWRHRSNIKKLLSGQEDKIGEK